MIADSVTVAQRWRSRFRGGRSGSGLAEELVVTTYYLPPATMLERFDEDAVDDAQLAERSFLARYSSRTLEAYRYVRRPRARPSTARGLDRSELGVFLFTTVEMLDVQDRIKSRFTKGLHRSAHLVSDAHLDAALARHPRLTGEQRQPVSEWCQRGHHFQTAIGRAGAGKTTTVAACAATWSAAGYRVMGAAVKGEATRTLTSLLASNAKQLPGISHTPTPRASRSTHAQSSSSTRRPRCRTATSTRS